MLHQKILSLTLASFAILPLCAQTEVSTYRPGITPEGITYFLPKTTVRMVLHVTHTHYEPGEYATYAERFLRMKDVTLQARDEWKITSAELETYGQADSNHAYTIKLNPKTSAPLVGLTNDGRLLTINAKGEDETELTEATDPRITSTLQVNPSDFKTQEILAAGSTLKMAELTANEIFDIRENRSLLAKGQADFMPKDGEQLRLMFQSLDEQEQGLLSLFTGSAVTDERILTIDYVPTGAQDATLAFRFSRHYGLVENDDLSGAPYYLSITDLKTLPEPEPVPEKKKGKKVVEPQDVRYMIPGQACISLTDERGNSLATVNVLMSQFGRVEHLGGDLFNKRFTTRIKMSPITGGIIKIEGEPTK